MGRTFAGLFNCTGDSSQMVECLRGKDAKELVTAQLAFLVCTKKLKTFIKKS